MPGEFEFDMSAAVDEISDGLGLDLPGSGDADDVVLEIQEVPGADTVMPGADTVQAAAGADTVSAGAPAVPEPPSTWRAEAKAVWAALPEAARAEVLKREADMMSGLDAYKANAAFGKSFQQILAPYMPLLQQAGVDPVQQVNGLMRAHVTLATGSPEQKSEIFRRLASDYQVDLNQLSADAPYVDPAVQALQSRLDAVQSQLSRSEQETLANKQASYEREVTAFASDPANPHFELVANDMAALIKAGVAANLKDAYERAVWANPVSRAKEVERQQAAAAAKQRQDDEAKAAAARAASAANVKSRPRSGTSAAPLGSLDDTLNETLAAIQARG